MVVRRCIQMLGIICSVVLTSCKTEAPVQQVAEYKVIKTAKANTSVNSTYSAAVRGTQDIDIFPQVSGIITQLNVEEGDRVKKGQVLMIIDQINYKAALKTAQANVEAAKAALATAGLTLDSKKELYANDVVSEFDLKNAENAYLSAKAQLALMEAQEQTAKNNLSYTEVKSPSDGVIGTLPYRVGSMVSAQMAKPLTTISDNKVMYAYFSMNETQLLNLTKKHGSKEEVLKSLPPVELKLNDNTVYDKKGKIESISGLIDKSTGSVTLRAAFDNSGGILYSGSSANVVLPDQIEDVIVIPSSATFEIQDKYYVYTVKDGKAASKQITVQPLNSGKEYAVLSGLGVNEEIITEGVGLLREGTPVKTKY